MRMSSQFVGHTVVRVCKQIYMCACMCAYVCTFVCLYACMFVCMYVCIFVFFFCFVCMSVCFFVRVCVCLYVCMFVCLFAYVFLFWYGSIYLCWYVCTLICSLFLSLPGSLSPCVIRVRALFLFCLSRTVLTVVSLDALNTAVLQDTARRYIFRRSENCNALQHTATHCNRWFVI